MPFDRRRLWLMIAVVTLLVVIETYLPFFLGAPLPIPVWVYGLGLGVAACLVLAVLGVQALLAGLATRAVWIALAGTSAVVQLFLVGGTGSILPFMWGGLPFVIWGLLTVRSRSDSEGLVEPLVFLFTVLLSTDFYHKFWTLTADSSTTALMTGGTTALLTAYVLVNLPRIAGPTAQLIWRHRRRTGLALVAGAAFVGLVWTLDRTPAHWEISSRFTGTLQEVNRRDGGSEADLPNIILISVDDLRRDHVVPPYPGDLDPTALRKLREDSIRFPRTYTTSSWTLPSHASLMTGELPLVHGAVSHHFSGVKPGVPLLPQYLRRVGYRTGAFTGGGYVSKGRGFKRGFDRYRDMVDPHGGFVPGAVEFASLALSRTEYNFPVKFRDHRPDPARPTRPIINRARRWIQARAGGDDPFFAFIHTNQVRDHEKPFPESLSKLRAEQPELARAFEDGTARQADLKSPLTEEEKKSFLTREPFMADTTWRRFRKRARLALREQGWQRAAFRSMIRVYPPDLLRRVKATIGNLRPNEWDELMAMNRREAEWTLGWKHIAKELRRLSPERLRARRWLYREEIRRVDRRLGTFLSFLKREGLYDESLIVFLSDHGEGFSWDPFVIGHGVRRDLDHEGQLHESLLRVPLWIKLPGGKRAGTVRDSLVQITDVLPMLFRHVGLNLSRWPGGDARLHLLPDTPVRSEAARRFIRGSVQSGNVQTANLFVKNRNYKLEMNLPRRTLFSYTLDPERNREQIMAPSDIPRDQREDLKRTLEHHTSLLLGTKSPYPGETRFREFLVQDLLDRL